MCHRRVKHLIFPHRAQFLITIIDAGEAKGCHNYRPRPLNGRLVACRSLEHLVISVCVCMCPPVCVCVLQSYEWAERGVLSLRHRSSRETRNAIHSSARHSREQEDVWVSVRSLSPQSHLFIFPSAPLSPSLPPSTNLHLLRFTPPYFCR